MSMPGTAGGSGAGSLHVIKKLVWSQDEDRVLQEQVRLHGAENWGTICLALPGRSGRSCRLRWCQYLSPMVDAVKPFTPDEDALILRHHEIHGKRWSTIATFLPDRSDNAIKNRWSSVLHKRYESNQPPADPCAAGQAADTDAPSLTQGCLLPLFPPASGDVRGHEVGPQEFPLLPEEDVAMVETGTAPECLVLFPLAPGDVRSASVPKCMDCGVDDPQIELRLAPAAPAIDAITGM